MRLLSLVFPIVCALSYFGSSGTMAQTTNSTNAAANTRSYEDASELAKKVMTTAELSIKTSDRVLSIMTWILGICLGGSALGVAALWVRLTGFMKNVRDEMAQSQTKADKLLEDAGKTASVFEQVLATLPIVFVDGIDEDNRIVALNTLAQLRRPELAPVFAALLRTAASTRTKAAVVYALGLFGAAASDSLNQILNLSTDADFNLRRDCARALAAIAPDRREVRTRLEEMTKDADDIVKDWARRGLGGQAP